MLVHLSWNQQGNELAVFDSVGRISIWSTLNVAMGELVRPKKCVVDVEDQLSAVVGLLWLNPDKMVLPSILSAKLVLSDYTVLFSRICKQREWSMEFYAYFTKAVRSLSSYLRVVSLGHCDEIGHD